ENSASPELGETVPDELRLQIPLSHTRVGFQGLELGLESLPAPWMPLRTPVIVVRVREGSPAHDALPREAQWSRGRDSDERVALLRPALPHLRMTVDLLKSVARALQVTGSGKREPTGASAQAPETRGRASSEPLRASARRVA
ncbi:MAG: hypothetical protein RJA70_1679, partial [Pseudomonadota bacterium]